MSNPKALDILDESYFLFEVDGGFRLHIDYSVFTRQDMNRTWDFMAKQLETLAKSPSLEAVSSTAVVIDKALDNYNCMLHHTVPPGIAVVDFSAEFLEFRKNHCRKAVFRAKCTTIPSIFLCVALPQPCASQGVVNFCSHTSKYDSPVRYYALN